MGDANVKFAPLGRPGNAQSPSHSRYSLESSAQCVVRHFFVADGMRHMKACVLAAVLAIVSTGSAQAYTTYLKPDEFWTSDADVVVEGAFANHFFTPAVAIAPRLTVLHPNGSDQPFRSVAVSGVTTRLETSLPNGGTYRVSTGEQLGAVTTLVGVDGQWRPLASGEAVPEGAPTTSIQTVTVSDVYVTRGGPTRTVVDRTIGRLAIRPVTHPNQVLTANGFDIEILYNGAPLANTAVVIYAAGDSDTMVDRYVATGADGRAHVSLDAPGHYVIAARHRATAPAGSEAAVQSHTTTLTFEALVSLPRIVAVPEDAPPERAPRRRSGTRNY